MIYHGMECPIFKHIGVWHSTHVGGEVDAVRNSISLITSMGIHGPIYGQKWWSQLASGYVKIAIENDHL